VISFLHKNNDCSVIHMALSVLH